MEPMNRIIPTLILLAALTLACNLTAPPQTMPTVASATETSAAPLLPSPSGRGTGGEGTPPSPNGSPPDGGRWTGGEGKGYITFVINVHDWTHPAESADILLRLVDLFEQYDVRGDFYFTAEIARELAENHPEVIERFRNSNMTISYHVRPPHPLYTGFDSRLKGLNDDELYQTLLDYETYALDLETGDLDRSRPGGYTYVKQVFGRSPVVAPAPNNDPRIKSAAQRVYASLGAQMTLLYHGEGTKINQPFEYVNGLLVRPSDFSVTRTTFIDSGENFWWNFMSKPNADEYNPTALLQSQLAEWNSHNYGRAPFVTSLIHENNFYRSGAAGWSSIYFTIDKGKKDDPLSPPFDLNAPDPSRPRSEADKAAIFAAYEQMVAYAAANLNVVTSEDILKLAQQTRPQ